MSIGNFEKVIGWQKSRELTILVYRTFKYSKDYSFKDQIQRASVSVMNNIAEGFERRSNKDLKNFLYMSKGSCGEVRSMLYLALDLGYIDNRQYVEMNNLALEISRILGGFIKSV